MIFAVLIVSGTPHNETIDNYISLFNELLVSAYLYTLFALTYDDHAPEVWDGAGVTLTAIVGISVVANFSIFFFKILRELYLRSFPFTIKLKRIARRLCRRGKYL